MWRELRIDRAAKQTQTDISTGHYFFEIWEEEYFVSEGEGDEGCTVKVVETGPETLFITTP